MKIHILKLVALLLALGMSSARSQTLDWASLTQSTIVDSQGDPHAAGRRSERNSFSMQVSQLRKYLLISIALVEGRAEAQSIKWNSSHQKTNLTRTGTTMAEWIFLCKSDWI